MRRDNRHAFAILAGLAVSIAATPPTAAQRISPEVEALLTRDVRGGADDPLTGRYAGSVLFAQTTRAFDEITLPSGPAEGETFRPAEQKFAATVTAQGWVTRTVYIAPPGRSSLEVTANFLDAVAAKGYEPVFRCAGPACGESFEILKYRWDKPHTHVLGEGYEHLRTLFIKDQIFTHMTDLRYALMKKSAAGGDSYVAVYGAVHNGNANEYQRALGGRAGVLVEIVEPRAMERRMVVVSAAEIGGKVTSEGRAVFYGILFDFSRRHQAGIRAAIGRDCEIPQRQPGEPHVHHRPHRQQGHARLQSRPVQPARGRGGAGARGPLRRRPQAADAARPGTAGAGREQPQRGRSGQEPAGRDGRAVKAAARQSRPPYRRTLSRPGPIVHHDGPRRSTAGACGRQGGRPGSWQSRCEEAHTLRRRHCA
jgi:OmpA-OmpF porin, OOP family